MVLGSNRDAGNLDLLHYLSEVFRNEYEPLGQVGGHYTSADFKHSMDELTHCGTGCNVGKVTRAAVLFEYTNWLDPESTEKNLDALNMMVGDRAYTCPVVGFANRYAGMVTIKF